MTAEILSYLLNMVILPGIYFMARLSLDVSGIKRKLEHVDKVIETKVDQRVDEKVNRALGAITERIITLEETDQKLVNEVGKVRSDIDRYLRTKRA